MNEKSFKVMQVSTNGQAINETSSHLDRKSIKRMHLYINGQTMAYLTKKQRYQRQNVPFYRQFQ